MKFVSIKIWYGGPSCMLYWKNNAEDCCGLKEESTIVSKYKNMFYDK